MHTPRKKKFDVTITNGDRKVFRAKYPAASLEDLDRRAVARAAGREVFLASKSTEDALDCLTSSIPRGAIIAWATALAKRAA